ncbi:Filamentous hemagglutinin [uncultured bacterium]|nr:Filamentous hemagglutinin [uncultured bacterium]
MFFLNNDNNDSIRQQSFMTSNLSMTNTQPSFFQSWFIGEDAQHSIRLLLFILVLSVHLVLREGSLMDHSPEPPKMKIVEVELVSVQPPPAPPAPTPPAPPPPKPEPPKPVPPKPKPTPPKPKPVPKPKPKPVEQPKVPDPFAMPVPAPVKAPPSPPVPYTPPTPTRSAAPSKPTTAPPSGSHKASITAHCVSSCGQPRYPSVAKQRGWEGTVRVKIQIAKDGSVTSVSLISSSGYDVLDEAAMDSIRDREFNEIDENIIRTATQTINFKLVN